jgi:putative phosphoribosyl transferase
MANNGREQDIEIILESTVHGGLLGIPEDAKAIVVFAHGSGSSRFSPRNALVARTLRESSLATLMFDLLTEDEDQVYENRFDIDLLAQRLLGATEWLKQQPQLREMAIGYFGASTGAAAALKAAAVLGSTVRAVVSRGGRPDLAGAELLTVQAATLLIVGGADEIVIELNKQAYAKLRATKELRIIPGASHLFEEPGALEQVARLGTAWFTRFLTEVPQAIH